MLTSYIKRRDLAMMTPRGTVIELGVGRTFLYVEIKDK